MNKFRFMDNRFNFYFFSGILCIAAVLLLIINGLNYGIDFKGGNIIHVIFNDPTNENKIREVFGRLNESTGANFNPSQVVIQSITTEKDREFLIQYPTFDVDSLNNNKKNQEIIAGLRKEIPFRDESLEVSSIGPTVGNEMKKQGILAAILSCIGLLLYLGWRFDIHSASGVVIAVIHDLIITLGFISLLKLEFDSTILVALLTLLGYSVNDSIVIFDRIRENTRISKNGTPYKTIVDNSINQSIGRTMNTTFTTLLALLAIGLFGGKSIQGFAIVLFFASIVGTYSSNCLAAPIVEDIFHRENKDYYSNSENKVA